MIVFRDCRAAFRDGRPHPRPDKTGPSELITGRGRFGFAGGTLTLLETFAPFTRADALDGIPFEVPSDPAFRGVSQAGGGVGGVGSGPIDPDTFAMTAQSPNLLQCCSVASGCFALRFSKRKLTKMCAFTLRSAQTMRRQHHEG